MDDLCQLYFNKYLDRDAEIVFNIKNTPTDVSMPQATGINISPALIIKMIDSRLIGKNQFSAIKCI